MSTELLPIWHQDACTPRKEVIGGTLTEADLALSLSAVAWERAKPPYNEPPSFFQATHLTRNMKDILDNILGRLAKTKTDVNPIIVLDVGFGGGKTHTLVSLYYAAKHPELANKHLTKLPTPKDVRIAAISGDEYGTTGIKRNGTKIRTLWGDLFWQLGTYNQFENLDKQAQLPSLDDIRQGLEGSPVLILLDELPSYLKVVAHESEMLDKTVQFIQRLILAISEKTDTAMLIAIAEDVYRLEAERARHAIQDAVKEAMEEARAHIRRKEFVSVPIVEEDVVHILRRRLFQEINPETAQKTAESYYELYSRLSVPDKMKSKSYGDEIRDNYPFHPELIKTLYERLATLDRFQRTRGALRLLSRTIRRTWETKEPDATLIHPFHIDLADEGILNDLTVGIGEERLRNASEADIWNTKGDATAQRLDEQSQAHWGAPLVRRACNTIYLYSLAAGREGERGVPTDTLTALCTTPQRPDHYMRTRDTVLTLLFDQFQFIDRRGERFVFIREPTPIRVIELLSRDVTEDETTRIIKETLTTLYSGDPEWVHPEIFPSTPANVIDEPYVKVAILNPNLYTTTTGKSVSSDVARFLLNKDEYGKRLRQYSNTTFLLVASTDRLDALRIAARKVAAARLVRENPLRHGIPKDRKTDVEEYLARQEKNLNDYIRAAYANLIYYDRDGPRTSTISPSGYGNAKSGRSVIAHHLVNGLRRIVESSLDPSYVLEYAWPRDAANVSTKTLYEQFHAVPGLISPATKELYQETVKRGITEGIWVLKQAERIFIHDKQPSIVPIDETAELLTLEEAEHRGLFEEPKGGKRGEGEEEGIKKPGGRQIQELIPVINLGDAQVETLADDLEKRAHRDRFNQVTSLSLRMSGNQLYLLNIKNLLTRLAPEKELNTRLTADLGRPRSPQFSLHLDMSKQEAFQEEGKSILDLAWRIKGTEHCDINLTLEWTEGETPEEVAKILRSLGEGSKEPIIARLEARVARGS